MKRMLALGCVIAAAAACGGGDNNTSNNSNPNNSSQNSNANGATNGGSNGATNGGTNGTPNGATNGTPNGATNGATNNTSTNNATTPQNNTQPINNTNPGVEVMETEPNDDVVTANLFKANDTLKGGAGDMDDDYWKIQLQGGSIFEVEVVAIPRPSEVYIDLVEEAQNVPDRTIDGDQGYKRQFFIPITGAYTLQIKDVTSENADYEIATRVLVPNPMSGLSVPGSLDGDLNDYAIDIYSYTAASDGSVRAEVTSDRTPQNTDMDGILMIYNPTGGLVTVNDDVDAMTVDPGVVYDQVNGTTYWVVVDAYSMDVMGPNTYTYASEIQ